MSDALEKKAVSLAHALRAFKAAGFLYPEFINAEDRKGKKTGSPVGRRLFDALEAFQKELDAPPPAGPTKAEAEERLRGLLDVVAEVVMSLHDADQQSPRHGNAREVAIEDAISRLTRASVEASAS